MIAGRGSLPAPTRSKGSLLLLLIPLLSPQGWDYVFLIGTPAVMLLVNYLPALPRELRIATVVAIAVVALEHLRPDGTRRVCHLHAAVA